MASSALHMTCFSKTFSSIELLHLEISYFWRDIIPAIYVDLDTVAKDIVVNLAVQ